MSPKVLKLPSDLIHTGIYKPKIIVIDDGYGVSHTSVVNLSRRGEKTTNS